MSDLSRGWTPSQLGAHIEILSGFAFPAKDFTERGEMPLIRVRDVMRGFTETYYNGQWDPKFLIHSGDLLVGMDGDFNRERWQSKPALLNQRVCKVVADGTSLDQSFLYHLLPKVLQEIWGSTSYATVKHLSAKRLREAPISLPPLNEQRRIAAILDKAQELVSAAYRATEHTQRIVHSQFDRLLRSSPDSQDAKLSDVLVNGLANGLSPSTNGTVPGRVLTLTAVSSGTFKPDESKDVLFETDPSPKQLVGANRLMITRGSGNPELVGVGTLGHETTTELAFPDTVMGGTINTDAATPEYVAAAWNSGFVKAQIRSLARTTNGTFKVNQKNLSQVSFPMPPRETQERFAETTEHIQTQVNVLRDRAERSELLGRALQSRAFRGEL